MKAKLSSAIIESVKTRGEPSSRDIQQDIAQQGSYAPDTFRRTLTRLVGRRVLIRVERGRYRLDPNWKRRATSSKEQTIKDIRDAMREAGGIVKTKEIHKPLWDRDYGDAARPTEHVDITKALNDSDLFSQDFVPYGKKGIWNLSAEERQHLPFIGRWVSYCIENDFEGLGPKDGEHWFDTRAVYFERVGVAFAQARGKLSINDVVSDPAIARMIDAIGYAPGPAYCEAYAAQASVRGFSKPVDPTALRCRLYKMFEEGRVEFHLAAPAAFYRRCGGLFGVCPAALSRGVVRKT